MLVTGEERDAVDLLQPHREVDPADDLPRLGDDPLDPGVSVTRVLPVEPRIGLPPRTCSTVARGSVGAVQDSAGASAVREPVAVSLVREWGVVPSVGVPPVGESVVVSPVFAVMGKACIRPLTIGPDLGIRCRTGEYSMMFDSGGPEVFHRLGASGADCRAGGAVWGHD